MRLIFQVLDSSDLAGPEMQHPTADNMGTAEPGRKADVHARSPEAGKGPTLTKQAPPRIKSCPRRLCRFATGI